MNTYKSEELFFVVDEEDNPLPPLPRKLVHGHGVWHRVAHTWISDGKGNVLCQQSAFNKELNPGMWEPFFGGHLSPNEEYLQGAVRELAEETGIKLSETNFKLETIYKMQMSDIGNNEFQAIFSVVWDGESSEISFSDGEVERVKWLSFREVLDHLESHDKNWTFCGYEIDLIKKLLTR